VLPVAFFRPWLAPFPFCQPPLVTLLLCCHAFHLFPGIYFGPFNTWGWDHYKVSKYLVPNTQWHSVTSQKNWYPFHTTSETQELGWWYAWYFLFLLGLLDIWRWDWYVVPKRRYRITTTLRNIPEERRSWMVVDHSCQARSCGGRF
jgi:hypothetical protein